jgi:hypothetical protein
MEMLNMKNSQKNQMLDNSIAHMSLTELRQKWAECWGVSAHPRIGRTLLEKSLLFRQRELTGLGLTEEQQARLNGLVRDYKRNPRNFDENPVGFKPGTKLVRIWRGKRYSVTVQVAGFEYDDKKFTSLSEIAYAITGTRWNGWIFFGLKKREKTA